MKTGRRENEKRSGRIPSRKREDGKTSTPSPPQLDVASSHETLTNKIRCVVLERIEEFVAKSRREKKQSEIELLELIRRVSTELPDDVTKALKTAYERETSGSAAKSALSCIIKNVEIAKANSTPICQDTGTLLFDVYLPSGYSTLDFTDLIKSAVAKATELGFLRPNAVDAVNEKNSGNNIGVGFPSIEFHEHQNDSIRVDLLLKGGGSENVSAQYSLPYADLDAGRDLDGVRKVVLHAIQKAQGLGCPPAIVGVGIGGDRSSSYRLAKKQLFRKLDDRNPIPELDKLERKLFEQSNALGIGPMGFGGKTTTLGIKIGAMHRLPACYFVSISYMCWAARHHTIFYGAEKI